MDSLASLPAEVALRFEDVVSREAAHFLPVVRRLPVALVEGEGSRVRDVDGREYVDLTAGWGVCAIGHCHPKLVDALREQAGRLTQTTNLFYTLPQLDLSERLARLTPTSITRTFPVNSGTEAVDGAIKLAHRATGRTRFVTTEGSFHGRTIGALSVIGQAKYREPYEALLRKPVVVPYGDVEAAREAIDIETAAVILEPVQGEGGVRVPPDGYLRALREACDATGALLVADEIQTGIGRTGRMFACEHDAVAPDVMTLGKGLGGGFPVAAFLCSDAVAATVQPGDHGGTYVGNPLACAVADAVVRVVEEEKLAERAARVGARLLERLHEFAEEHPERCREARGRGLLVALELKSAEQAAAVQRQALEAGVLVNLTQGTVLRFFPALNIPEDELFPAADTLLGLVGG